MNDNQNSATPGLVVGVGASAGGLEALKEFCASLPKNTGMAFIIVQHSNPNHVTLLADILRQHCPLPVEQASDASRLLPNHVYTAPADHDLVAESGSIRLVPRTLTHRVHMPVDTLFCSLAQAFGPQSVGVVLSGTGSDGTIGLRDIKTAGGITFAQDEKTAQQSGMPKSAIHSGHVDQVLSPSGIATELGRMASLAQNPVLLAAASEDLAVMKEILALVKAMSGVDFTDYKQTTVSRRIQRRVVSAKLNSLSEYLNVLRSNAEELEALYRDILINVTCFFRDPEMFEALEAMILPRIADGRGSDDPIRVWVPGCSSGEEVYSLAILLEEYKTKKGYSIPIQIFGTDISEPALEKARSGIYSPSIASLVSPERLERFFDPVEQGYQIKKDLRESCVFACQNVVADPPLSRMDLISCRNLLIYFGPALQERVVPIFHYALKSSNAFLVLGRSEMVDVFSDFFIPFEKTHKFYKKKDVPLRLSYQPIPGHRTQAKIDPKKPHDAAPSPRDTELDIKRETDRFILANFSPSAVVVTENCDIIQFRGYMAPYLDPAGRASFNLFKMLHPDLLHPIRQAIQKAKEGDVRVIKCNQLRHKAAGELKFVNVRVIPLRTPALKHRYFLLIFEEAPTPPVNVVVSKTVRSEGDETEVVSMSDADEIRRLTEELEGTRQHLQAVIDERDIGFEELQAANEETTSANEELQTINQELETAKEELESSNEELATLNEQLRHNMELLRKSEEQFRILVSGVKDYAIFMLDPKGYILSWNDGAQKIKGYTKQEIIGEHFSIFYPEEDRRARKPDEELVIAAATGKFEEEGLRVRKDGTTFWANVVITALYSEDGKLYGFAKVTRDITEQRNAEISLRLSEERFRHIVSGVKSYGIFMLDPNGYVVSWNEGAERIKGYKAEEIIGRHFSKFYPEEDTGKAERLLQEAMRNGRVEDEGWRVRKDGTRFWADVVITAMRDDHGKLLGFSKVTKDLTEKRKAEEALKLSEERFRLLISGVKDYAIFMLDETGRVLNWNSGAESIEGYSTNEIVGHHFSIFFLEKDRLGGKPDHDLALAASTGHFEEEGLRLRKNGSTFWANVVIRPLTNDVGELTGYAVVTRDISEQKRLQIAESERIAAELASKAKSAFLANMSHEIRTPLTAIVGFAEFLADEPSLEPQTLEYIDAIKRNAEHLTSLVSEVLDLSKVEASQMEVKKVPTQLEQEINTVVTMFGAKCAEKGVALNLVYDTPVPDTIWTDPLRLKQILVNIIGNAIKFTDAGSITVNVSLVNASAADAPYQLVLRITDTGCGIAPDQRDRIFRPFVRAMESNPRYGGTGLGLSLSRELAKLLDGDVRLERSELGEGSTFAITIDPGPLDDVRMVVPDGGSHHRATNGSGHVVDTPLAGVRVLLVEDTPDNQVLFRRILKAAGAEVALAVNGKEGIHMALQDQYDVILMDMRMPVMGGCEATAGIREKGVLTPVIALTANATKEEREKSLAAGCDDYLSKPISSTDLMRVVSEWVRKGRGSER